MLTKELSEKYFSAIKEPEKIEKICLSTKSFGDEAADVASEVIAKMTSLKIADLSDFIAGRETSIGLSVLNKISTALAATQLVELDLSENALGPRGIESCRPLLASKETLQRLSFCNDGLSAEAMESIRDLLLFRGVDQPTSLKSLRFHNNMSGSGGAIAIAKVVEQSPLLERFELSSTRCGRDGGACLSKALEKCPNLISVDLSDNTFGAECGEILGNSMKGKMNLEKFKAGDISLEDDGAAALLKAFCDPSTTSKLEVLSLEANDITVEGLENLSALFRCQPKMSTLTLDDNCEFGSRGVLRVARALRHTKSLTTLALKACDIKRKGAVALAKALASNKGNFSSKLTILLDENRISSAGMEAVSKVFESSLKNVACLGPMEDNDDEASDDEEFDDDDVKADVVAESKTTPPGDDDLSGALDKLAL
jgi:Ran GTPase-activating protein 1